MTALLGLFGAASDIGDVEVRRMIDRMHGRGNERSELVRLPGVTLYVGRYAWEAAPEISGRAAVVRDGDVLAIADAFLVSDGDEGGKAGKTERSEPAETVIEAYRRWGAYAPRYLRGEFAWILVDLERHLVLAARDAVGRRPLHYSALGQRGLVVASSATAVTQHPAVSSDLDLGIVAAACSALGGGSDRTGYRDVRPLLGAHALSWSSGGAPLLQRFWEPPSFSVVGHDALPDPQSRLRHALADAIRPMLAPKTAVFMSGGYDSTAVFAIASSQIESGAARDVDLLVTSVSFPPNDIGHEDQYIRPVAERWGREVNWIDSETLTLLDDAEERAADRDDPQAHAFEIFNAMLARRSRERGFHVALDGFGGDFLFGVSDVYLADLLFALRLPTFLRQARAEGYGRRRWQELAKVAVLPRLRRPGRALVEWLAGHPVTTDMRQDIAAWTTSSAVREHGLDVLADRTIARRFAEGASTCESRFYYTEPFFPRAMAWNSYAALREGVEVRSPLMDAELTAFAAARPVFERGGAPVVKRLLVESMRGLLPDIVLAPRGRKTGLPAGYLGRRLVAELPHWMQRIFPSGQRSHLARSGLVSDDDVRKGVSRYVETRAHLLGVQLLLTLQAELWMRTRR